MWLYHRSVAKEIHFDFSKIKLCTIKTDKTSLTGSQQIRLESSHSEIFLRILAFLSISSFLPL